MFEAKKFNFDKLDKNAKKKLYSQIKKTEGELGRDLGFEETADMVAIKLEAEDGGERKRWFMKMEEFPVGDGYEKLEDMLEASAKYPDLSLTEAVERLKKEKKKK